MPVCLGQTRYAHETILGSTESKSGHIVVEMGGTVIVDRVIVTEKDRAHEDLTLDGISVLVGVVLNHDTTKRVTSKQDVISGETSSSEL